MLLNETQLTQIVYGAAFLGSGGGGAISTGLSFVKIIMENTHQKGVILLSGKEVEIPDITACVLCDIGAITAIEKNQAIAINNAYLHMSAYYKVKTGKHIAAVFPIETGPENTLAPFVLASYQHIPVVDGDGAGRAVPDLGLCTFGTIPFEGDPMHQAIMADELANWLLVNTANVNGLDKSMRNIASSPQFGSSASLCLWVSPLSELYNKSVRGSILKTLSCGELLAGIKMHDPSLIHHALPIVNELAAALICAGKVVNRQESESGAFNFGTIHINDSPTSETITILNQNENLIAFGSNHEMPLCCAPDSICYLDQHFQPLTNCEIKPGMFVFVIAIKAHEKLYQPEILTRFCQLISSLGYAGKRNQLSNLMPLGDLLIELYAKH